MSAEKDFALQNQITIFHEMALVLEYLGLSHCRSDSKKAVKASKGFKLIFMTLSKNKVTGFIGNIC